MGDEELYLEATTEVEGDKKDPALWAKVMALTEGDQDKAKYKYIKLRVEKIAKESVEKKLTFTKKEVVEKKPESTRKIVDEFHLKYMPIAEFTRIKSIPEKKVIEMIRGGFYVGKIKDNEWFVSRNEVGGKDVTKQTQRKPSQKPTRTRQEYIPVEEFAEYKGVESEKAIEMIRGGFYQGRIIDDEWYVACSEVEETQNSIQSSSDSFLSKLVNGDYSLAKTYWLFGVLVSLLFFIPVTLAVAVESMTALIILSISGVIYSVMVFVGIWRASDKYRGPKVWAVSAKIVVIIGIVNLLVDLVIIGNIQNA